MNHSNSISVDWESLALWANLRKVARFVSCSIDYDDRMFITFCSVLTLKNRLLIYFCLKVSKSGQINIKKWTSPSTSCLLHFIQIRLSLVTLYQ